MKTTGEILLDIEPHLEALVDEQELQAGDVLALIHAWLTVHRPECFEQYTEGGKPEFYYGYPREKMK